MPTIGSNRAHKHAVTSIMDRLNVSHRNLDSHVQYYYASLPPRNSTSMNTGTWGSKVHITKLHAFKSDNLCHWKVIVLLSISIYEIVKVRLRTLIVERLSDCTEYDYESSTILKHLTPKVIRSNLIGVVDVMLDFSGWF